MTGPDMTGPEHYAEAERLVEAAASMLAEIGKFVVDNRQQPIPTTAALPAQTLAAAQVHATLALAAATIEVAAESGGGPSGTRQASEWMEVLS